MNQASQLTSTKKTDPASPSARSLELARRILEPKPRVGGRKRNPSLRPRILSLKLEQLAELVEWLTVEQATYAVVEMRLLERFGLRTGDTALSGFWSHQLSPLLLESRVLQSDSAIEITVRPATATEPAQVIVRSAAPVILKNEVRG